MLQANGRMAADKHHGPGALGPTYLRAWRVYRGLTLEQLEAGSGVDKGTISKLERGRMGYRQETLERLADALHCSPSELIDRHPEEAEALWCVIRELGPADRRRLGIVAEGFRRSGFDPPEDADRPAPGREAARLIGPDGRPREPSR